MFTDGHFRLDAARMPLQADPSASNSSRHSVRKIPSPRPQPKDYAPPAPADGNIALRCRRERCIPHNLLYSIPTPPSTINQKLPPHPNILSSPLHKDKKPHLSPAPDKSPDSPAPARSDSYPHKLHLPSGTNHSP